MINKKSIVCTLVLLLTVSLMAFSQGNVRNGETENFRRSSLCLMLITHKGDEYAKAIEQQFLAMPLPSRYNALNVDVRVINSYKKKLSPKRVAELLSYRHVARDLVAKWFNRDYYGRMNMDRIHDWGGYNATYADLMRAQSTVRGTAMLTDEGTELLQNTFVMVCDISYYNREQTGQWLSALLAAGAGAMNSLAQQQQQQGKDGSMWSSLAQSTAAGAVASQDIGGFSVKVKAHLFRMQWNNKLRDRIFNRYWVDDTTPSGEAASRKAAFDSDTRSFNLDYLGTYYSRSGRTVSKSSNNLQLVIQEVCEEATNKSINNLAKMFPVFKAKTPFYCENGAAYAYIGTKEGINMNSKFEVLETRRKKGEIEYKKVGEMRPVSVWNNNGLTIMQDSLTQKYKGTRFARHSGRRDVCDQGLLLREKGRLGYQYSKRNFFYIGLGVGETMIASSVKDKVAEDNSSGRRSVYSDGLECETMAYGMEFGWVLNFHTNFAWNVLTLGYTWGDNGKNNGDDDQQTLTELLASTGIILRTNPGGKRGRWTWFLWPSVGIGYNSLKMSYYGDRSLSYDTTTVAWNVKFGVNITERFGISANVNDYHVLGTLGFFF